jgi:hypothetical protein
MQRPPPDKPRPRRLNRGRWEAIPYNVRLTLSEAAAILGITRDNLRKNYSGNNPHRALPEGYAIESESGGKTLFLIRHRLPQETT